ncbi:hypothetical protein BDW02DRAFT_362854 [Decorospora gaudefroyi]|uniref:Uncharacterized protein n=1 Tax=Decorospora gaudefroyi TaxID=184978 RepID=A0A6A5KVJ4_9PLEO|nr:hypothetical protein BDW02DRAFT_362854 [Decorospora gaudefroyi]
MSWEWPCRLANCDAARHRSLTVGDDSCCVAQGCETREGGRAWPLRVRDVRCRSCIACAALEVLLVSACVLEERGWGASRPRGCREEAYSCPCCSCCRILKCVFAMDCWYARRQKTWCSSCNNVVSAYDIDAVSSLRTGKRSRMAWTKSRIEVLVSRGFSALLCSRLTTASGYIVPHGPFNCLPPGCLESQFEPLTSTSDVSLIPFMLMTISFPEDPTAGRQEHFQLQLQQRQDASLSIAIVTGIVGPSMSRPRSAVDSATWKIVLGAAVQRRLLPQRSATLLGTSASIKVVYSYCYRQAKHRNDVIGS